MPDRRQRKVLVAFDRNSFAGLSQDTRQIAVTILPIVYSSATQRNFAKT